MALELVIIPCLSDNFAYLIRDKATGETALIDAPEARPILAELKARGWGLDMILITHHHADHIDGVDEIRKETYAKVLGAKADAHRLPLLDQALSDGDKIKIGAEQGDVIAVDGHTLGHIAFHFPQSNLLFTADSLMAGGCGRLFEGTPAQMYESLQKLALLPAETRVCSGHDYLKGNLAFALALEPENPLLKWRIATVEEMRREGRLPMPWTLAEELNTNPFLRADLLKTSLGMQDATDAEVFAEIRKRKDSF